MNWEMQFNFTKCEFLRLTRRKHPILANYTGECIIQEATHIKYLIVTIDSQLTWNVHAKAILQTRPMPCTKSFLHAKHPPVQPRLSLTVTNV